MYIYRWWEGLHVESRFPFARDRVVECYLWILGVYYEPCYSRSRIILTMIIAIVTLLDDIYDSYATPEECEILTKCIERFVLLITNTFYHPRFTKVHVYLLCEFHKE